MINNLVLKERSSPTKLKELSPVSINNENFLSPTSNEMMVNEKKNKRCLIGDKKTAWKPSRYRSQF